MTERHADPATALKAVDVYARLQSQAKAAKELGISRAQLRRRLAQAERDARDGVTGENVKPFVGGRDTAPEPAKRKVPTSGVQRYVLSSAQNNTSLHKPTWDSLLVLAAHYRAEILVSRFAYNQNAFSQPGSTKPGTEKTAESLWYAPEIVPYTCDTAVELAPGLVFCGEMQISPTATNPLSDLKNYTRRKSAIFPHTKLAMLSVPTPKDDAAKLMYTTGAVTKANYVQRKAGQKAEFYHTHGAALVEVDSSGNWFVRQLQSDDDGCIADLDKLFDGRTKKVRKNSIRAITWGDIHIPAQDPTFEKLAWGAGGVLDTLRPAEQHMHDVLDFRARNHHEIRNPHRMFDRFITGADSVGDEITLVTQFLSSVSFRPWCNTVVVDSNHDNAFLKWLATADYREDPANALLFLRSQTRVYEAIAARERDFHLLEWACFPDGVPANMKFLRGDESHMICNEDKKNGIECGLHGDKGPNGSRGSAANLSQIGRKSNIGHSHSACIVGGTWQAGTSSKLDLGYNTGPSSWSHTFIVTYANGRRAMITTWGGKWRA